MISMIIIGRKGSVGFKGKNTHKILGRPLCSYPLLAAKHSKFIDNCFVSTDDPEIRKIAKSFGAVNIERPKELATDEALGEDVYVHAYNTIKEKYYPKNEIELLILMMCNAPTILALEIDKGIAILKQNSDYDSAVTVSAYNMWSPLRARKIGKDGLLHPFVPFEYFGDPKTLTCDRDSQGDVWFADMGVSIVRPYCLDYLENGILPQKWMGQKIYPLKHWGGLDVDYEWQIPGVEFWLKEHGFTQNTTPYENECS